MPVSSRGTYDRVT
ncbi:hypothetical protein F383_33615 [Gossypium arboreum]|uniref:Uncharacterized protein n=1 Tax=Gossypium arboreum TaxID=29729 RepID=A0A0B0N4T6_GOSAR|nr:hypothetical protein F383_33615 [Gossypium arboreum]